MANNTAVDIMTVDEIWHEVLAQMAKEIEDKVIKMTQDNASTLATQSGVEPLLTENEIKFYVEKVLDEVKTKRGSR
jgi:hypothetical protein